MDVVQVPRRFVGSEWGGTETVILETSKRLPGLGHRTEILCPLALSDRHEEDMGGVKVRRFSYFYPYLGLGREARRRLDQKGGNLFSFSLMRALKRRPSLDLVHLHTQKRLGGICRHVCRSRGIPYVVSLHGGIYDVPEAEIRSYTAPTRRTLEWGKLLGWWVGARRVLDDAAAVICVGAEEKRRVEEHYPKKRVEHLPNGVDVKRFAKGDGAGFRSRHGIASDAFVFLTLGRIDPQKNQLALLGLVPEILKSNPKAHLLFIGHVTHDAYREELDRTIASLGVERSVTVLPGLDAGSGELVDAYHSADVFVLPSIHETFGIVILEAWAAGLPVIASAVGGILSLVEDGRDGILVDPRSEVRLLEAIRLLSGDPARRESLARAGREKAVASYDWDSVTARLAALYEEIVHANPLCQ